ncbi:MAG TPA: gliding motility-associated protein GldE [Flavobacteriales bacterium]
MLTAPPCLVMDATAAWSLVGVVLLLVVMALSAAGEMALFTLTPTQVRDLQERGGRAGRRVMDLLARPRRLRSTALTMMVSCSLGITALSTLALNRLLDLGHLTPGTVLVIHVALIVSVLLLVGEVVPKAYGAAKPVRMAMVSGGVLLVLRWLCTPINEAMVRGADHFTRKPRKRSDRPMDVDTLEQALDLTTDTSTTAEEKRILRGIVQFGNIEARQVMRPRTEIAAFNEELDFRQLLAAIRESGFSRVPVFRETSDHIVGILHIKDVLPHLNDDGFDWRTLLREPWFVPENKKLDDLLKEFQAKKLHLAVVVDEYGGTSGIVTMEDVIEEIVGEITDEYDDEELFYSKLDERTWVFEGRTALPDVYKVLGIEGDEFEEQKGDSGTLGGFVLELTGRIPRKGERVEFRNYRFMVESADNKRLRRIKVHLADEAKN